jgi:hypothetical protein
MPFVIDNYGRRCSFYCESDDIETAFIDAQFQPNVDYVQAIQEMEATTRLAFKNQ